jgi:hypothetical protein
MISRFFFSTASRPLINKLLSSIISYCQPPLSVIKRFSSKAAILAPTYIETCKLILITVEVFILERVSSTFSSLLGAILSFTSPINDLRLISLILVKSSNPITFKFLINFALIESGILLFLIHHVISSTDWV